MGFNFGDKIFLLKFNNLERPPFLVADLFFAIMVPNVQGVYLADLKTGKKVPVNRHKKKS